MQLSIRMAYKRFMRSSLFLVAATLMLFSAAVPDSVGAATTIKAKGGSLLLEQAGRSWNVYYIRSPAVRPLKKFANGDPACGPYFYPYNNLCYCKRGYVLTWQGICQPFAPAATFERCEQGVCMCAYNYILNGDGNGCEAMRIYKATDELPCIDHKKPCTCVDGYAPVGNRICKRGSR